MRALRLGDSSHFPHLCKFLENSTDGSFHFRIIPVSFAICYWVKNPESKNQISTLFRAQNLLFINSTVALHPSKKIISALISKSNNTPSIASYQTRDSRSVLPSCPVIFLSCCILLLSPSDRTERKSCSSNEFRSRYPSRSVAQAHETFLCAGVSV